MNRNAFINTSVKGRMAFVICCAENAITFYQLSKDDWDFVLDVLWRFMSLPKEKDFALWHENEGECVPWVVEGDVPYEESDIRYLNKEQYYVLNRTYNNAPPVLTEILDQAFQIATCELYGSIRNNSPQTLKYVEQVINFMSQNNIPLPDAKLFTQFGIEENNGWGRAFTRTEVEPEAGLKSDPRRYEDFRRKSGPAISLTAEGILPMQYYKVKFEYKINGDGMLRALFRYWASPGYIDPKVFEDWFNENIEYDRSSELFIYPEFISKSDFDEKHWTLKPEF